jgi:hypothetical protein
VKIEQTGAAALILGTLATIGVMAFHPTGVHAGHAGEIAAMLRVNALVHGTAIVAAPLLTFGTFVLTRSIGFANAPAAMAFFAYLFGALAVMLAASMSGLVAPRLMESLSETTGAAQETVRALLRLEWYLNQAFATLHVALFSGAIALWALGWPDKGVLAAAIQITGLVVGVGIFGWLASGALTLDVHGMGAVVLTQGAWTILAAFGLLARAGKREG